MTYLNECRTATGVKAMLVQARALPDIVAAAAIVDQWFAGQAAPDFVTAGPPRPTEAARLFVGMVAEIALIDYLGTRN